MSKKIDPQFIWNDSTGEAVCSIRIDDTYFIGTANCAPEDKDMQSEKVGCYIAFARAQIKYLKHLKRNDVIPRQKALKQYYYSISKSQKYNPNGYCEKMLRRQFFFLQEMLDTINKMVAEKEQELETFLSEKEKFYLAVRKNRKASNS